MSDDVEDEGCTCDDGYPCGCLSPSFCICDDADPEVAGLLARVKALEGDSRALMDYRPYGEAE